MTFCLGPRPKEIRPGMFAGVPALWFNTKPQHVVDARQKSRAE